MIGVFKDSFKLSLLVTAIFFAGILASAYVLYTLPHDLRLIDGYQLIITKTYIVIAITFLLGGFALYTALKSQREVVVYRDRKAETTESENNTVVDETKTTITLDGVKTSLNQATSEKEILQAGLDAVCKQLEAGQGALYLANEAARKIELKQGYALSISENTSISFDFGEGLVGQCATNGKTLYVDDIPDGYIKIISGLGSSSPKYLLVVPVKKGDSVTGVMEIASFTSINENQRRFAEESANLIAEKIG